MNIYPSSQEVNMTIDQIEAGFDALQRKLVPLWRSIGRSDPGGPAQDENTIVVVASMSLDKDYKSSAQQAYEERFLFMLLLLRQPNLRIVYVTSQAIQTSIIDYYMNLIPGTVASQARKRLFLVSPLDASPRPLTAKLLERPRLLRYIRSLIPDLDRAHLVPYNTTGLERELAVRLGIPMYAADPRFFAFGTKSGGRRILAEEGVQHPLGFENLSSVDDIVLAIAQMRVVKPSIRRAIVKLNEGVSGQGNALVDLGDLPTPGDPSEKDALAERVGAMLLESPDVTYPAYITKLNERGGIIEELITGEEITSPSVQMRVSPLGEVEVLSTHDQLLGGPTGQSYLGCRFPANPEYAPAITREAVKVGARFAREGIVGRFALDFVVVGSKTGDWDPYAIEINLRKGGTTHPFLTLQYLTDGHYNAASGTFITSRGQQKCYVASDHLESPLYRTFTPDDLFDIVSRHRLHFDHARQTGIVMHMLSGVGDLGRLGLTAIADTYEEADALYAQMVSLLDEETRFASP
jgi:hypothetical protein